MSVSSAAQSGGLLQQRPFVLLWLVRLFATMGYQMLAVVIGWKIYEITGSAFDLGMVGLLQFIPVVVLTLLIGHTADRYDRRLIMAGVLSRFPVERNIGRKMFAVVALFGAATVVFGLSTSFPLSLAALAVLGASDAVSVVIRFTLVQLETPDDMRGRVSAINYLFVGSSNTLGEFESGAVAGWLGAVPSVVIGGIGSLLVAGAWMGLFPELRHLDRFEVAKENDETIKEQT